MFYAISKRRRDINAAEARGREIGWKEGFEIGRIEILEAMAARFRVEPDANPMAIIAELRAQFPNRPRQQIA